MGKYKEYSFNDMKHVKGFYKNAGRRNYYFSFGNGLVVSITEQYYNIWDGLVRLTREEFKTEIALRKTSIWQAVNG